MPRIWTVVAVLLTVSTPSAAQFQNGSQTVLLNLPRTSQKSVLTQRVGLTDITITYHRPLVNGRTIFGDMVPYDRVWRVGANDNTTIDFTNPVQIEGHALEAGRYGVHMIPGTAEWTVIFSRNSGSWGSFSYDPKEDALRVNVAASSGAFREALTFDFADLMADKATLVMSWERVSVPLHFAIETKTITLASLRNELRHLPGFKGEAWFDAALYCVDNQFNYAEARQWIDRSIQMDGETFDNLDLKAQILDGLGQHADAAALQAKALGMATPQQLYGYGDRLLRETKLDEAKVLFLRVTKDHPDAWITWYGLARVQIALGDRAAARKSLEEALVQAKQPAQKASVQRLLERLAAGQAIG